jgi:uncharacterized protein YbaR (Trm112 family)
LVAELVRETVLEQLYDEVPYSVACGVEEFREGRLPVYIRAVIYVERDSAGALRLPPRKGQGRMSLDPQLLEILVCPKCRGELEYSEAESSLVCRACSLRYPIRDDIPIMLIDEAEPL